MIKYYILLFVRNMRRQKLFSAINLLGLTAGIVSTLLIYLYVQHQFSYDRFHANADHIFRINQTFIWGENDEHQFSSTGPGVAYALQAEIPEVKEVTRVHAPGNFLVSYTNAKHESRSFDEKGIFAVDSNFLKVFTFPLLKGNVESSLRYPNSVVLTESTAKRYFGEEDAVGKILEVDNIITDTNYGGTTVAPRQAYEVTGVVQDPPENSYIQFDILVSMSSFPRVKKQSWSWIWTTFETYVLLDEHASIEAVSSKLPALPRKYAEATLQNVMNQSFDDYTKNGKKWELFVQPLTSIHLYSSNVYNRLNDVGSITTLYILMGVEAFIILLSCINFMNLSTAQYTRRIKESSLRKVLGSDRSQLAMHFFSEALMFCVLAAAIGLGITQLVLPYFNVMTGNDLHLRLFSSPEVIVALAVLIILMSVLSGSYPAIFLSKFSPVEAMKGKLRTGKQGRTLRNGLVTFQFVISMVLIVSTVVVFQQLHYLASKDIGFNRENLVIVNRAEWINDKKTFLHAMENIPGVEEASWTTAAPPRIYDGDQFMAEERSDKAISLNYVKADDHYLSTLDLKLVVGRNFSDATQADKERVILNEAAVKEFGWKVDESVLGKKVSYPGQGKSFEVVGVVKDFNYWALQAPIQALGIFHVEGSIFSNDHQYIALRIKPGDADTWNAFMSALQKNWKQYTGDAPFQYEFVDQAFAETFKAEAQFGKALIVFASLAIMIACFGLLGMIIYTLEQRTKEIGIRKVVGASVWSIWIMIVKDYTYLILAAVALSTPFCIWFLNNWLEDFNYRIVLTPWSFVIAGGSLLLAAISITSYHVLKAARMNPVSVLKDE
ncbi:MAG TPA: ABC transporter permease [Ohtaekwangia sp.]